MLLKLLAATQNHLIQLTQTPAVEHFPAFCLCRHLDWFRTSAGHPSTPPIYHLSFKALYHFSFNARCRHKTTCPSTLYTTSTDTSIDSKRQQDVRLASIHELITGQRNFGGARGRHFSRGSQAEPWKLRFCGHLVASMWEPIGWMLQTFMASGNRGPIKRRMVSSTLSADWSFTSSTATLYLFWYIVETISRGKANTGYQVLNNVKRFRSWRHLQKF